MQVLQAELHATQLLSVQGVDVVWETVGGKMFDTCARNLAMGGRLLVIGLMSVYGEGWPASQVLLSALISALISDFG